MSKDNKYADFIRDAVNERKYGMCRDAAIQIKRLLPELFDTISRYDIVEVVDLGDEYTTHPDVIKLVRENYSDFEYGGGKELLLGTRCVVIHSLIDIYNRCICIIKPINRNDNKVFAFGTEYGIVKLKTSKL